MAGSNPTIPDTVTIPTMFERHFSVRTLSELWGYSEDTIQIWFEAESGVLKHGDEGDPKTGRKRKVFLRIPESVAMRVYEERTK
jgi:hypothetical protein